jgi:hypothetical protein
MDIMKGHDGCDIEMQAADAYDLPKYLIRDDEMAAKILPDMVKPEEDEEEELL